MEDRLYTTQEVAKELGVTDGYIRRMIVEGKTQPKQMIGHTWVFDLAELERLRQRAKPKGGRPPKQK